MGTSTLGECVRDVFAIYDNNISPGLLMIIIKIIILYFIQIRHTDDFPPTGTPASSSKSYRRSGCYEFTTTVETHFEIIVKKNLPET